MVRLKHRYLLLEILYPDPTSWPKAAVPSTTPSTTTSTSTRKPSSSQSQPQPQHPQLQIHSPTSNVLTPGLLAKMVREEVAEVFGDWGVGRLGGGVSVKYLSPATSTAIIRCPRASFRLVWSALSYMSHVPDFKNPSTVDGGSGSGSGASSNTGKRFGAVVATRPCVFRVLRVSGTMRKAEEEAIRGARREIVRLRVLDEKGVMGGLVGSSLAGNESIGDVVSDEDDYDGMGTEDE